MKTFPNTCRAIRDICALITASTAQPALAECNDLQHWLRPPGREVKVLVGYTQVKQIDFEGRTIGHDPAYPVPLPLDLLKKTGTVRFDSQTTNSVSYYEPDGKGNFRVCRVESWWAPGSGDPDIVARLKPVTKEYIATHELLSRFPPGSVVFAVRMYFYDAKGRFERLSEAFFDRPNQAAVDLMCRRYDEKNRVIMAVAPNVTKVCPEGAPDIRDSWRRYKYADYMGDSTTLLALGHSGAADGSWVEKYSPFRLGPGPDDPLGNADVDSKNGVTVIFGSNLGKWENNSANTVVDSFGHWRGSTYTFTNPPVPLAVLDNPDLIYKYERRRQTYVDSHIIKLFEFFRPNENISRHRYYMLDGFVLRHEQVDSKGKVVRVITIEDWRQPRPGPKPDVDDNLLSTHHVALLAHQVFHRVYDIDTTGKPVLVAVSWNRANRLIKGKVPIDYADLVYGTPDGKERWKTEAEFEKAFNTSAHASHVFPEEQKKKP